MNSSTQFQVNNKYNHQYVHLIYFTHFKDSQYTNIINMSHHIFVFKQHIINQ